MTASLKQPTLSDLLPFVSWESPAFDGSPLAIIGRTVTQYLSCHVDVEVKIEGAAEAASRSKVRLSAILSIVVDSRTHSVYLLFDAYSASRAKKKRIGTYLVTIPRSDLALGSQLCICDSSALPCLPIWCAAVLGQSSTQCIVFSSLDLSPALRVHWLATASTHPLDEKLLRPQSIEDIWTSQHSDHCAFTLRPVASARKADATEDVCLSRVSLLPSSIVDATDATTGSCELRSEELMRFPYRFPDYCFHRHSSVYFEKQNILFFTAHTTATIGKRKLVSMLALNVCMRSSFSTQLVSTDSRVSESGIKKSEESSTLTPAASTEDSAEYCDDGSSDIRSTDGTKTDDCSDSDTPPLFEVMRVCVPQSLQYIFEEAKCHFVFWQESSESIVLLLQKSNKLMRRPKMKRFIAQLERSYDSYGADDCDRDLGQLLVKLKLRLSRGSLPSLASVSIGSVRISDARLRIAAYDCGKAAVWLRTARESESDGWVKYTKRVDTDIHLKCRLQLMRLNDLVFKWHHIFSGC